MDKQQQLNSFKECIDDAIEELTRIKNIINVNDLYALSVFYQDVSCAIHCLLEGLFFHQDQEERNSNERKLMLYKKQLKEFSNNLNQLQDSIDLTDLEKLEKYYPDLDMAMSVLNLIYGDKSNQNEIQ